MKTFAIRRVALTLGAAAVLAFSAGVIPTTSTPSAQAAELAQHGGGHHGGGHHGGGHRHWSHVPSSHHVYDGAHHRYQAEWYHYRHISFPHFYQVYTYE